ncbi:MAG: hypothetical protein IMF09_11470 [Proteobacteria bacterium]|nr:hypothetical protein [Pseudomonadota bacterium]
MSEIVTVVTGASSQIGYFLIPALLAGGGQVIAVSRQSIPGWFKQYKDNPQLHWCNVDQLQQLSFTGPVDLISAGPLVLAGNLVRKLPVAGLVAMSSASVLFKQDSSDASERRLIAGILQAEEDLTVWAKNNQKNLHILRPTLVYGCGLDKNLSRVAALVQRFGFMPVAGQAKGIRQPVHAEDISSLIVSLLAGETKGLHTWELAGGSRLTYAEMIEAVFMAQQKPVRLLRMPLWVLRLASRLLPGINPQMINRQNHDLCVDDTAARKQLNWHPRSFSLSGRELSTP